MAENNELKKEIIDNAKKTLENKLFQDVLGSNQVKNNPFLYGQLASQGADSKYEESINTDEAKKIRDDLYGNKKRQGNALGVYGEPSISNYDVSLDIIQQVEENKKRLPLGELENVVKGVANGLQSGLPDELKEYVIVDIEEKIQKAQIGEFKRTGKIDPEKIKEFLTEEEVDAFNTYQALSQAYNRGAALNSSQADYFSDSNQILKNISEKYSSVKGK